MSEAEQVKREMVEILERIPSSGSFESAKLAAKVSQLSKKMHSLNSAPAPEPAKAIQPVEKVTANASH